MVLHASIAVAVFVGTYILISVGRSRRMPLERPMAALLGAGLMLLVGAVAPWEAVGSIQVPILGLLLGMMLLAAGLERCNFFSWAASRMLRRCRSRRELLILLMGTTALLSAVLLNDAVVLILTPIVIRICQQARLPPAPYLIGEAFAANIGSVATPVGNPQNAFIAEASGIPFLRFSATLLPLALLSLLVAMACLLVLFRAEFGSTAPPLRQERASGREAPPPLPRIRNPRLFTAVLAALALSFAGFILGPRSGGATGAAIPLGAIALAAGLAVLVLAWPLGRIAPGKMLRRVDWGVLVLFVGLFILLRGVANVGLDRQVAVAITGGTVDSADLPGFIAVSAVLSNLVSNVPATLLLAPTAAAGGDEFWLALAASSTLAGNATLVGAAANLIVAERAGAGGVRLDWRPFTGAGLVVATATLVVTVGFFLLV